MANTYDAGNVVKLSNASSPFTQNGSLIDPSVINYVALKGDGVSYVRATYTAGTGDPSGTIIKDSTGVYHVLQLLDVGGLWTIRFYSTGTGQASYRWAFEVTPDVLV